MNPALKRLGLGEQDRVLIIHADDIGMCQATIPALADALDFGLVTSAALMAPCAWFPAAAAFCRANPEIDVGVHLTLNSEWVTYRWGPISTRDPATGLLDSQGYFHQWPPETFAQAAPAAVEVEIRAQVERALGAGIEPTHVDSHMGTVAWPPFTEAYIKVAREYRLPLFFLGGSGSLRRAGLSEEAIAMAASLTQDLLERGVPLFDAFESLPLDDPTEHVGAAKAIIDGLQPGLTMLVLHPSADTPELRAITPDWPCRVANLDAVLSRELRDYVWESGVLLIGYRPLLDLVRGA